MRAMVDYSPQQDWSLPCPDVGMSFRKGQLLEVVDQTDGHWWQARRLPTTSSCAGLIPSTSMLKRYTAGLASMLKKLRTCGGQV